METEVCVHPAGTVAHVYVKEGETVKVGDPKILYVWQGVKRHGNGSDKLH